MGEGDLRELRDLIEFLKASGVAEFDMERPELKVRLTFGGQGSAAAPAPVAAFDYAQMARLMAAGMPAAAAPAGEGAVPAAAVAEAPRAAVPAAAAVDEDEGLHMVKSPLVGTFYDAASPGAEPFTKVGDRLAAGKVMCIVEAMKIMNEIEADVAGEVVKVYVKPGQPVEYGQKLFGVRV